MSPVLRFFRWALADLRLVEGVSGEAATVEVAASRRPGCGKPTAARLQVEAVIVVYQPMTLVQLAEYHRGEDDSLRWRLVAEFLEEYRQEPPQVRLELLAAEPGLTGDERWDVFFGGLSRASSL